MPKKIYSHPLGFCACFFAHVFRAFFFACFNSTESRYASRQKSMVIFNRLYADPSRLNVGRQTFAAGVALCARGHPCKYWFRLFVFVCHGPTVGGTRNSRQTNLVAPVSASARPLVCAGGASAGLAT